MMFSMAPGLILMMGAVLTALFYRFPMSKGIAIGSVGVAMVAMVNLTSNATLTVPFLFSTLQLLRVDTLSLVFGALFVGVAAVAFLYGIRIAKPSEYVSGLVYVGAALGVVFSGDFVSLYVFWELMALSSMFLILLTNTNASRRAAWRYIMVHLVGGLVLLAGVVAYIYHTGSTAFTPISLSDWPSYCIFIGFLVNAAAVPVSSWLSDAYPESTPMGGLILSSITTKTAVYALFRGFSGTDALIWIGCLTALYGVVYGLLENNIRRSLSFSVINQIGVKLVGIGLGSPLALAGVCVHVVCGVMYNMLLWMSANHLISVTGGVTYTGLSGRVRRYPWMIGAALVGSLSIAAFPFTSGYTSKTIIIKAVEYAHLLWPWLCLELASVGVILFITGKFTYYGWIHGHPNVRLTWRDGLSVVSKPELIMTMVLASVCIYLGLHPAPLYDVMPYAATLLKKVPSTVTSIYGNGAGLVTKLQLFFFSILGFMVCIRFIPIRDAVLVDVDWVYRRLLVYVMKGMIGLVDGIYRMINRFVMGIVSGVVVLCRDSVAWLLFWVIDGDNHNTADTRRQLVHRYRRIIESNTCMPLAWSGMWVFIASIYLLFFLKT